MAGRAKPRRPRVFDRHAGRWKFGMRAAAAGQLVQMDHMSVSFPGATVKNFTAVCPTIGYLVARATSRATSHNAARFLEQVLDAMPFAVHSIQVDGGSEQACQARGIALYVLPPKSPKRGGCVERAHPHATRGVLRSISPRMEPAHPEPTPGRLPTPLLPLPSARRQTPKLPNPHGVLSVPRRGRVSLICMEPVHVLPTHFRMG